MTASKALLRVSKIAPRGLFGRLEGRKKMLEADSEAVIESALGMTRVQRVVGAPSLLAQAPRGGTIIKENRLNNDFKQDLTRRWAAGPANFIDQCNLEV